MQTEKDTNNKFRSLFLGSPLGNEVLGYMLEDLGLFRLSADEGDRVLGNFAKQLLKRCGLWSGSTMAFVQAIARIQPK